MFKNFIKNIIIGMALVLSIFTIDKIIVDNKPRFDIEKYDNEVREYVVNKRSRKIHIGTCASVDRMSDKNKMFLNNTLINIINDGYVICNNCNAGREIKKSLINKVKEIIFGVKESEIIKTISLYDDYMKSVNKVGEWYVNNIPTYQTELEEMKILEYIGEDNFIEEIELDSKTHGIHKNKVKYKYIAENGKNKKNDLDKNTIVLKGKDRAIENYKVNYKKLTFKKDTVYYPCEYLANSKDNYKKAGDDCVRFFFSCMNAMNNNFTNCLKKCTNIKWSHINTKLMFEDTKQFAYSMKVLGFEIYDTNAQYIDFDSNDYPDGKINVIESDFKLKKGDILATNGHIHIYLDDNYGEEKKNFGWGKVNYLFPQNSKSNLVNINNERYEIVCNGMNFTRVYRYIGIEEE